MGLRTVVGLTSLLVSFAALPADAEEYSVAIVPQMAPAKLAQAWMPFLERVSKESGVRLKFVTAPSIVDFETRLLSSGKADFAWSNPLDYVLAAEKHGYVAIAREAQNKLKGIVVVKAAGPLKTLTELRGKAVVVPKGAFAADTLVQVELARAGLTGAVEVRVTNTHDSAYLMVLSGQVDAAGGVMRTFKELSPESQAGLRVLHNTQAITPHPFSAHPRVPADVVKRVREAILRVGAEPANRDLLVGLKFPGGFETAEDADYQDARQIRASLAGGDAKVTAPPAPAVKPAPAK
jgi:phosphonate transport system substrate-binding protein